MTAVNLLSRAKQIDRARSRDITLAEHMFNRLRGPRVHDVLSRQDTLDLFSIANSVGLSSKPKKKFEQIDQIMTRKGFTMLGRGTNRITYRFLEDTSFVAKVAFDDVGCKDNPREYINQGIFQPYITKVFDYSPEGAVGIVERVEPIRNRAQFLSVADDVYFLLDQLLISGEYVLADVGSDYWANYGIRQGFGPVLLDFPYVFKIDGNKLYCHAPAFTPTGICGGEIDFDEGFNELRCTKCGVKYNASELAECTKINIESPFIGVGIGAKIMKMTISINGKTKVIGGEQENNAGMKTPVAHISTPDFSKFIKKTEKVEEVKEEDKVEVVETTTIEDNTVEEAAKEAVKVEEKKEVPVKKEKKDPFIHGKIKSYMEQFDEAFKNLLSIYQVCRVSDKENLETYNSTMIGLVKDIINDNSNDKEALAGIYEVLSGFYLPEYEGDEDEFYLSDDETNNTETQEVVIDEDETDQQPYTGIAWYQATTIDIKDIFDDQDSTSVLVLNNEDGTYFRDKANRLIAIDDIDGQDLAAIQIVSKKVVQQIERDTNTEENVSTGAFPPSQQ